MVKYLSLHLDNYNYKGKESFFYIYSPLFCSKYIKPRVKIPILTYGCAIWFNIFPSVMENIRIFKRKFESGNYNKNIKLYN